jgi:hypothetical protein
MNIGAFLLFIGSIGMFAFGVSWSSNYLESQQAEPSRTLFIICLILTGIGIGVLTA